MKPVESFLQHLARAVRQVHTYPSTSPVCTEAVEVCHRALASIADREHVDVRITPRALIVDEVSLGAGTVVGQELAGRLHRAHVAALTIDRTASPRDGARFCGDLVHCSGLRDSSTTLADLLAEHGVEKITLRLAHRLEVLDVGAPPDQRCDLVGAERRHRERFELAAGPTYHLYPPDKGWVRLDPASKLDAISLTDLAILVDDPSALASMLLRLTDDEPSADRGSEAGLVRRFADVTTILSALEPRLARVMFAKLARAVLDLDGDQRDRLLRRTILPDLIDGRGDGAVLREFPDLELADSLCLLLDLETSAPEVMVTALRRLDLPADRQAAVVPLIESRLAGIDDAARSSDPAAGRTGVERHARRLVRIEAAEDKSFAAFAAFDLALDEAASADLDRLRAEINGADPVEARLGCLFSLVRLEPNPDVAARFLARALVLFDALECSGRWEDLAQWMASFRQLGEALREPRPDVAEATAAGLAAFWTRQRLLRLGTLHASGPDGYAAAGAVVEAFGSGLALPFVTALAGRQAETLVPLMCAHARVLAPDLVGCLGRADDALDRVVIAVLGYAGKGYETVVAGQLRSADEQTVGDALQALTRIGTPRAAALVANALAHASGGLRDAAEEALLRFPQAEIDRQTRAFLGRRDLVLRHPQTAGRLLDRAERTKAIGLDQVLRPLVSLRFRFWNPAVVSVGIKARMLLAGP